MRLLALPMLQPRSLLPLRSRGRERLVQPILPSSDWRTSAGGVVARCTVPSGNRGGRGRGMGPRGVALPAPLSSTWLRCQTGVQVRLLDIRMLGLGVHNVPGNGGQALTMAPARRKEQTGEHSGKAHQFRFASE